MTANICMCVRVDSIIHCRNNMRNLLLRRKDFFPFLCTKIPPVRKTEPLLYSLFTPYVTWRVCDVRVTSVYWEIPSWLYLYPLVIPARPSVHIRGLYLYEIPQSWSRIHERTISLRFLGIILRVLRLEVSVYNVYITNQFQTTLGWEEGGVKPVNTGDCNSKEENS